MMFDQVKLGIAPIAWTNDDDPSLGGDISFEACIQQMHDAGYVGCEVGNKFPRDPDVLHAKLNPLNLQIASAWFSTYFTDKEKKTETIEAFKQHMHFLNAMGAKVIVVCESGGSIQGEQVPLFGDKPVFSEVQWQDLMLGLHTIGQLAQKNGMRIVFHQHMGAGVQTEEELHYLMEQTHPDYVSLLLDTGHLQFAGIDPTHIIHQYANRIAHVHLKDLRQAVIEKIQQDNLSFMDGVRAGVFTVPGDGVIDFDPIFSALSTHHYQGWFIVEAEQDPKKADPFTYAKMARQFIRQKTGL